MYVRMRSLMWVVTFVIVCGAVTTLLKTVDRTIFRSGRGIRSDPPINLPTTHVDGSSTDSIQLLIKPPAISAADQHWEAMKLLSEAEVAQREAIRQVGIWKTEIEPLRADESGDVVAVNKDLVQKLTHVFNRERKDEREIEVLGEQIGLLQQRLATAAAKDPPQPMSAREMFEVRELHAICHRARQAWETAVNEAGAIVLKAQFDANPVAQPTLQQEMNMIKAEEVLERLDEKMEREEDLPVVEEIDLPAATEIDPELRAKAHSPEVKSALAPFLEPRKTQPSLAGRFSIKFTRTFDEQPMSFGKLVSIGALDNSMLGLQKLALIAGNRKLPEPKWSIASQPNNWNEGDEQFLRNSQQMLRDYGPVLVAEGLLSP